MTDLSSASILVAGCGGLGCYAVEYLVRLGVGSVKVADGDVFDQSNMNRQLYCTAETIGRNKAEAAASRWPGKVVPVPSFIDEANAASLVSGCAAVVDALDNSASRKLLASACAGAGIPFIHGAVSGGVCQVCALFPEDGDLADVLFPDEPAADPATFSYVPALCASLQVSLVHNLLSGGDVKPRELIVYDAGEGSRRTVRL